jgi:hypothetical protein
MTELERYERIPDPGGPFEPTKAHARRQRQAVDIHEAAVRLAADAPPLSAETIAKVTALLRVPTPPTDLMQWRLRLYCGHEVVRRAHHTHHTVHAAFMGGPRCEQCGLDPATIVAAKAIGRVEEPHERLRRRATSIDGSSATNAPSNDINGSSIDCVISATTRAEGPTSMMSPTASSSTISP